MSRVKSHARWVLCVDPDRERWANPFIANSWYELRLPCYDPAVHMEPPAIYEDEAGWHVCCYDDAEQNRAHKRRSDAENRAIALEVERVEGYIADNQEERRQLLSALSR